MWSSALPNTVFRGRGLGGVEGSEPLSRTTLSARSRRPPLAPPLSFVSGVSLLFPGRVFILVILTVVKVHYNTFV